MRLVSSTAARQSAGIDFADPTLWLRLGDTAVPQPQDARFLQLIHEAKLCARLSHANVVQTYDLGHINGCFFIGMERISWNEKINCGCSYCKYLKKAWRAARR